MEKTSPPQELRAFWSHLLEVHKHRKDTQPFDYVVVQGLLWACANIPNLFSGASVWFSLAAWVTCSVWAVVLVAYLRRLSRKKTVRSARRKTLLHLFNNGVSLISLSGAVLLMGIQIVPLESTGRVVLLGLYAVTLVLAALLSYWWFVLPNAVTRFGEDPDRRRANSRRVVGIATPAGIASLGVAAGIILARSVEPALGDTIVGVALTIAAFVLVALGAAIVGESYIFARLRLTQD